MFPKDWSVIFNMFFFILVIRHHMLSFSAFICRLTSFLSCNGVSVSLYGRSIQWMTLVNRSMWNTHMPTSRLEVQSIITYWTACLTLFQMKYRQNVEKGSECLLELKTKVYNHYVSCRHSCSVTPNWNVTILPGNLISIGQFKQNLGIS
jgi:hypothetical protein